MLDTIKGLIKSAFDGNFDIKTFLGLIKDILMIIFGKVAEDEGYDYPTTTVAE